VGSTQKIACPVHAKIGEESLERLAVAVPEAPAQMLAAEPHFLGHRLQRQLFLKMVE